MSLFYKLALAVLISAVVVITYDLFQVEIEKGKSEARVIYDVRAGRFTFEKPSGSVRIVYASMFGPGEPVMRVRDDWISRFEKEYSDRLSGDPARAISGEEARRFVAEALRRARRIATEAGRRLEAMDSLKDSEKAAVIQQTLDWLAGREVLLVNLGDGASGQEKLRALRALVGGLEVLAKDAVAAEKVTVAPRVKVEVERRWQGRWVLSANRPRFLTGREVPDIMVGSKMELLALVQDRYAVPLCQPLPGEKLSPLDAPDTYGQPRRRWRDAFIPAMLEEGKYSFLEEPDLKDKVFLAPLTCFTYCIFYNELLFERVGVATLPRTWPEFLGVCEKLKAAGITPLTADQDVYSDAWMMWLIYRILGPEAWERTVAGFPANSPPRQRRCDPPWTAPGYVAAFSQIRLLRERGCFDKDFRGLTWPAAQRGFAGGSAAMMICGSWLVQELGGYKDTASEEKFKLKCFSFPQWPGGREIDQKAAFAGCLGLMVCRQGQATRHAIELVKYLSAKDHGEMVHKNAQISCMKDADFPPALAGIADDFKNAPVIYSRGPNIYARRFSAATLSPLYRQFFLAESGEASYLSVEEFLKRLHKANTAYLDSGGEEGYE